MSPAIEITRPYKAGCLGLYAHPTHPILSWVTGRGFPARTLRSVPHSVPPHKI